MIKCLECGKQVNRIQWTHLRYKCSGNLKTVREYMEKYPGAPTVDQSLAKKTAITLDNLVSKYGEEEGTERWNEYRKRQSTSNTYEYKRDRHGWTKEQFDEYNRSRSCTVENFVRKHGEVDGLQRWDDYCERQRYTTSREYFVEKYGEDEGVRKFNDFCFARGSSGRPEDVAKRLGISLDEAVGVVISQRTGRFGVSDLEIEFTDMLSTAFGGLEHTSSKNPFGKWCHSLGTYVIYDIKHQDFIIEFNGDYWHANPRLYDPEDVVRNGVLAKDLWEKDRQKVQTAVECGFRVLTVWEYEFRKSKTETIKKVIEWILSGQK